MELKHLINTLTLCVEYHTKRGNETRIKQLENQLEKVKGKRLEDVTDFNGLYLG